MSPATVTAPPVSVGRLSLVVKTARMYHEEGLLQPEIAERLNMTQSRVSRMLKEAARLGIVRTVVATPPGLYPELEQAVRTMFDLRDVVVTEAASDSEAGVLSSIGSAAASYLEGTLRSGERIGVTSRSASLFAMVDALGPVTTGGAEVVVQTLGAVGNPAMQVRATRLTDRLSQLTGGEPIYLPAPGVVTSKAVRDGLLLDPYIGEAVAAWRGLTLALVGIGSAKPSPLRASWGNALPQRDLDRLIKLGAVGDVCLELLRRRRGSGRRPAQRPGARHRPGRPARRTASDGRRRWPGQGGRDPSRRQGRLDQRLDHRSLHRPPPGRRADSRRRPPQETERMALAASSIASR